MYGATWFGWIRANVVGNALDAAKEGKYAFSPAMRACWTLFSGFLSVLSITKLIGWEVSVMLLAIPW